MSQHLVDRIDRTLRAAFGSRRCDQAIQERVGGVRGLEARHGSEVVGRGVNRFAASDCCDDLGRPVTQTKRAHRDERAVVGPEGEAKVHFQHAVGTKECQSALLPDMMMPRSRGPSNVPPLSGAVRRVPWGTAPMFSRVPTFTCIIINKRVFIVGLPLHVFCKHIGV